MGPSPHAFAKLGDMTGRALVLVVEDEPDVRELIADVLAEHGYEIEVAPDGAAALQLCDQRKYDLILSDLRMPKMDGAALYWALQLRHGSAMPRMIYVTGQAHSMAYVATWPTGCVRKTRRVTIPKLPPPPPRSAQ